MKTILLFLILFLPLRNIIVAQANKGLTIHPHVVAQMPDDDDDDDMFSLRRWDNPFNNAAAAAANTVEFADVGLGITLVERTNTYGFSLRIVDWEEELTPRLEKNDYTFWQQEYYEVLIRNLKKTLRLELAFIYQIKN